MQHHGPNQYPAPLRGTPGWWQELGHLQQPEQPVKKKRSRKRSSSANSEQVPKGSSRIRVDLVARVRREIAAGTYDTPERWEAALDRLLEHLDSD
jgi:hypothetical protein